MGDELFDPWFNESDIDLMRHGYDVPRTCFRAGWDLAQERIAELEAENQRLQGENESLLVERRRLEAELAHANIESVDLENENQRLRDALQQIADTEADISWLHCLSYMAKQALEKET